MTDDRQSRLDAEYNAERRAEIRDLVQQTEKVYNTVAEAARIFTNAVCVAGREINKIPYPVGQSMHYIDTPDDWGLLVDIIAAEVSELAKFNLTGKQ